LIGEELTVLTKLKRRSIGIIVTILAVGTATIDPFRKHPTPPTGFTEKDVSEWMRLYHDQNEIGHYLRRGELRLTVNRCAEALGERISSFSAESDGNILIKLSMFNRPSPHSYQIKMGPNGEWIVFQETR
jgi:hypothetical protein